MAGHMDLYMQILLARLVLDLLRHRLRHRSPLSAVRVMLAVVTPIAEMVVLIVLVLLVLVRMLPAKVG